MTLDIPQGDLAEAFWQIPGFPPLWDTDSDAVMSILDLIRLREGCP